jgi:hypothetical protein
MQTFPSVTPDFSSALTAPPGAINVVVFYDTPDAEKRAESMLPRITGILGCDSTAVDSRFYRLDFMHLPSTAGNSVRFLYGADLYVLSTSGNTELPLAFRVWFRAVLNLNRRERVNVIPILGLDETTGQVARHDLHFIEQLALVRGIVCFAPLSDEDFELKSTDESGIKSTHELVSEPAR